MYATVNTELDMFIQRLHLVGLSHLLFLYNLFEHLIFIKLEYLIAFFLK